MAVKKGKEAASLELLQGGWQLRLLRIFGCKLQLNAGPVNIEIWEWGDPKKQYRGEDIILNIINYTAITILSQVFYHKKCPQTKENCEAKSE